MKEGYVCLSLINVVMKDSKSIEQILNVIFMYKPKKNARLFIHSKMTYFHLECQNPIKK
jgi:hypothetical protein